MSATVTPAPYERPRGRGSNLVFKSGPLYISSKGLGWKSWKRRWFILTRTSLVFFKNDPNVLPQKGGDSHTLGGIELNNSGSVIVGAAKKLTVLFPDGRAFTLKAETMDDVDEWKVALERALAAAPNAALVVGHNGIFRNDSIDAIEGATEQGRERSRVKSVVVGRPILLALEDIDGSPTFLEKALRFLETYGLGVEGILRQSADVDEVERRVRDFEQGHTEFGPDEDAHVIGDCIKHILRELPSSPVPTPCCTALLEAHRLDGKEARVASMRIAVAETFPEPNRRLLQRVLRMMRAVGSHTSENRMTPSAVAACMAPLLLRPLLAGECGLDDESDISGDNAAQLLAATTAANNAQAIVTTLLEEYDNIFEDDTLRDPPSPNMYANLDGSGSDEESEEDGVLGLRDVDGYHDAQNDLDAEVDEDFDRVMSGGLSESSGHVESDVFDYKVYEGGDSDFDSPKGMSRAKNSTKGWTRSVRSGNHDRAGPGSTHHDNGGGLNASSLGLSQLSWDSVSPVTSPRVGAGGPPGPGPGSGVSLRTKGHASMATSRRTSLWGITSSSAKTVSVDMTDSSEEELAIQRLEATRNELRNKIQKEAKGNAVLQASLERRKQALHDRRLALEQDVARLQSQLQMERDLRAALEAGLSMSAAQMTSAQSLDSKTRAELEEIAVVEADVARLKQKVAELHLQLSLQKQQQGGSLTDASERHERVRNLQSQQALLQQELDLTLALCHQEKQKNDEQLEEHSGQEDTTALETFVQQQRNALAEAKEALMAERNRGQDLRGRRPSVGSRGDDSAGGDWRTLRPPAGPSAAGRQFAWRQHKPDAGSLNDASSKLIDSAMELSNGGGYSSDGGASTSSGKRSNLEVEGVIVNSMRASPHHPAASPSAALAELTTRLDFFKERRSQLMEQLHTLDPTLVPPSLNGHDLIPASPLRSP